MQTLSVLLGQRIKEVRESKNIKQVELANMIDIEPTNLSKIEKGAHLPKNETINKIAKVLDTDITSLLEFKHLQSREELLKNISDLLSGYKVEDLQFFYKILTSYNEAKRN